MKTNRKTILFVEDNPLVLAAYRNRLQREGFNVEAAEDGAVAVAVLPKVKPDLVILDLMLPKLNGMDVLKFIRDHAELTSTPVMILSNAYMDDRASKAMTAGANKRMLKTQCTPAKLIDAVRELLEMPRDVGMIPGVSPEDIEAALAKADEISVQDARKHLLKEAPTDVAKIREHCLAFVKAAGTEAGAQYLDKLYQQVRFLCARAGLGDCTKIAHLSSALEAILFEIIFKKSSPSPSMLQTIAQAVDCLGRLFQNKEIESVESVLKAKVLIVDDDPVCNFVTIAAMKRAKLDAVSTQDPIVALEMAQRDHYDIVLLDINMPGLNGFEVCEKLRLLSDYQKTPVIFVTSNSEFQSRARAVLSGGNDLIAKPISPLELALKTIMHLIEPQRSGKSDTEIKSKVATEALKQISAAERIEMEAETTLEKEKPKSAGIKISLPGLPPEKNKQDDEPEIVPRNIAPPKIETPSVPATPPLFPTEPLPAGRINSSQNVNGTYMKNGNENNSMVHKVANEVARIIFGDDQSSEMHLRLTRIALERYNIPQIISQPDSEAFNQMVPEIGHIMFGDEKLSEMHLRLTRIALERYGVHQMLGSSADTNGRNGSHTKPAGITF